MIQSQHDGVKHDGGLSIKEIFNTSFDLFKKMFLTFWGLSIIAEIPNLISILFLGYPFFDSISNIVELNIKFKVSLILYLFYFYLYFYAFGSIYYYVFMNLNKENNFNYSINKITSILKESNIIFYIFSMLVFYILDDILFNYFSIIIYFIIMTLLSIKIDFMFLISFNEKLKIKEVFKKSLKLVKVNLSIIFIVYLLSFIPLIIYTFMLLNIESDLMYTIAFQIIENIIFCIYNAFICVIISVIYYHSRALIEK